MVRNIHRTRDLVQQYQFSLLVRMSVIAVWPTLKLKLLSENTLGNRPVGIEVAIMPLCKGHAS